LRRPAAPPPLPGGECREERQRGLCGCSVPGQTFPRVGQLSPLGHSASAPRSCSCCPQTGHSWGRLTPAGAGRVLVLPADPRTTTWRSRLSSVQVRYLTWATSSGTYPVHAAVARAVKPKRFVRGRGPVERHLESGERFVVDAIAGRAPHGQFQSLRARHKQAARPDHSTPAEVPRAMDEHLRDRSHPTTTNSSRFLTLDLQP